MGNKLHTSTVSDLERLKERIKIDENGCWIWQLSCDKDGYGHIGIHKKLIPSHIFFLMSYIKVKFQKD